MSVLVHTVQGSDGIGANNPKLKRSPIKAVSLSHFDAISVFSRHISLLILKTFPFCIMSVRDPLLVSVILKKWAHLLKVTL